MAANLKHLGIAFAICVLAPVMADAAPILSVRAVGARGFELTKLKDARSLLSGDLPSRGEGNGAIASINMHDPKNTPGHFAGTLQFPAPASGLRGDFAAEINGMVQIPASGKWTFGIHADDGFDLRVGPFEITRDGLKQTTDALATFTFTHSGVYGLDVVYYQHTGSAELELFAAAGTFGSYAAGQRQFQLVGNSAGGGLRLATVGSSIPEPSGVCFFVLAGASLLSRRRRGTPARAAR